MLRLQVAEVQREGSGNSHCRNLMQQRSGGYGDEGGDCDDDDCEVGGSARFRPVDRLAGSLHFTEWKELLIESNEWIDWLIDSDQWTTDKLFRRLIRGPHKLKICFVLIVIRMWVKAGFKPLDSILNLNLKLDSLSQWIHSSHNSIVKHLTDTDSR